MCAVRDGDSKSTALLYTVRVRCRPAAKGEEGRTHAQHKTDSRGLFSGGQGVGDDGDGGDGGDDGAPTFEMTMTARRQ